MEISLSRFKRYKPLLFLIAGPSLSCLFIFYFLISLFVPLQQVIPIVIVVGVLLIGLVKYYTDFFGNKFNEMETIKLDSFIPGRTSVKYSIFWNLTFICSYGAAMLIALLSSDMEVELFVPWYQFTAVQTLQLIAGILLAFFFPGLAVIKILDIRDERSVLSKLLFGYLISIFITGFSTYLTASLEFTPSESLTLVLITNTSILVLFAISSFRHYTGSKSKELEGHSRYALKKSRCCFARILGAALVELRHNLRESNAPLLVFSALFVLVALLTYILFGGTIVGDQWFHHGRALLFQFGGYGQAALSTEDHYYVPLLSASLGMFFDLSGVPSVNAYVSLNFLNMMPILAFYYFFNKWIPFRKRKAALLASVLFAIGAGYGWVYVLDVSFSESPTSSLEALDILNEARIRTFDIFQPSSFVGVDHPGITSPLLVIALPAGLVFLGMLQVQNIQQPPKFCNRKYMGVVGMVLLAGLYSHYEFSMFIIIGSVLLLAYRIPQKNLFFATIMIVLTITVLFEVILPGEYFSRVTILGFPLILLTLCFVGIAWIFAYTAGIIYRKGKGMGGKTYSSSPSPKPSIKLSTGNNARLIISVMIISLVFYFILFTYLVWGQLSLDEIRLQTSSTGQHEIPWYLYFIKLGTIGLLGIAFVLSYLFRRFDNRIFVFGIISVIALFAGSYYDEHRFSKYVMLGMAGFASLMIYEIMLIIFKRNSNLSSLYIGVIVSVVVTSSALSVLLFASYTSLALENNYSPYLNNQGGRFFPTTSEMEMFEAIHREFVRLGSYFNVATSPDEYDIQSDLIGKIRAFTGVPGEKLLQGRFIFNSPTLEEFYRNLRETDTHFIVLPKEDKWPTDQILEQENQPARFAAQNFQKFYENDDYLVLSVPTTGGSSSDASLAVTFPEERLAYTLVNASTTIYSNDTFEKNDDFKLIEIGDENKIVTRDSAGKKQTLWAENIEEDANYIGMKFRITNEEDTLEDGNLGVTWVEGHKQYQVIINDDSIDFESKSIENTSDRAELSQELETSDLPIKWHTLEVTMLGDTLDIQFDESPTIMVARDTTENETISKVGILASDTSAEFQPIKLALVNETCLECFRKEFYNEHDYPVSILALTNILYDSFPEKNMPKPLNYNTLILTSDPNRDGNETRELLRFVKGGGTLIVAVADPGYNGTFSKMFYIDQIKRVAFDSIARAEEEPINVSGIATEIKSNLSGTRTTSYYLKDQKPVAPLSIEKEYIEDNQTSADNSGKIILVNIAGYYDTLVENPNTAVQTLPAILNTIVNTSSFDKNSAAEPDNRVSKPLDAALVEGMDNLPTTTIELPGDLSNAAKEMGSEIPWRSALITPNNIALITTVVLVGTISGMIVTRRLRWGKETLRHEHHWW